MGQAKEQRRGRAATQCNSYRLMMAVAQAKEQEEEKVRDRGEGLGEAWGPVTGG